MKCLTLIREIKWFGVLHFALLLLSVTGILSKLAARFEILSAAWVGLYVAMIFVLGIYALIWQQVIKRIPPTTAFVNKAVTIVWALIWGIIFFGEDINAFKIIGAIIVICGVVLFVESDASTIDEDVHHAHILGEEL